MTDILIIGGGTAGMTAAVYASRGGKSVLVFEQSVCGGQIIVSPKVENYPGIKAISGADFAAALFDQALSQGAEFCYDKAEKILKKDHGFTVIAGTKEYDGKALIIATGAKNRPLGLPEEENFIGKGVSYCAACDGNFFKGKSVAVVGGGNTALEDALYLSELCEKVTLIHRRETFRGEEKKLLLLKEKENVEFLLNSSVTALHGTDRLSSISAMTDGKEAREIPVSGLFLAIGQIPDNEGFSSLVSLDEHGYIIAGEDCKTAVPGIFAAGDCRTKQVRQLATAAADGAVSALAAGEYCTDHR